MLHYLEEIAQQTNYLVPWHYTEHYVYTSNVDETLNGTENSHRNTKKQGKAEEYMTVSVSRFKARKKDCIHQELVTTSVLDFHL